MYKLCIFAGTTEGRELVTFLSTQDAKVTACVATEYGQTLLPAYENLTVSSGRLSQEEMEQLLLREHFHLVIDATHPYAAVVTENIAAACRTVGAEYIRLLRDDSCIPKNAIFVQSIPEAAAYLDKTVGNILLTTGSKELRLYSALTDFASRAYARVLPMDESLRLCREAGLQPSHILAMQGPFSKELNIAMLRTVNAAYMVTKASGVAGGFDEKMSAAKDTGVIPIVIGRPPQREGLDLEGTISMLCTRFGFKAAREIAVIGIGPGSRSLQTAQAQEALARADCVIGAKRMLEAVKAPGQFAYDAVAPEKIRDFIISHDEYRRFAVAMSGDIGFFSGAKKLLPLLDGCKTEIIPGISSLVYLCAKLGVSYEDVSCVTLHGRENPILLPLSQGKRVFTLVGGENGMGVLCKRLTDAGLGNIKVSVGENLSYPEERIAVGTAQAFSTGSFAPLCAALLEPVNTPWHYTPGLADEAFCRTPSVPMTKSEIRALCLSKLALPEDAVIWDVGAGTGSVSIEIALSAPCGHVYAIERRQEAIEVLKQNISRFHTDNVHTVFGTAPECCADLPAPTHAFLGGTSGNMQEIIGLLTDRNPHVRIAATAVTLESIAELTACMKQFSVSEAVCVNVSRDRCLGSYRLMTAQNPIYIFTMQN